MSHSQHTTSRSCTAGPAWKLDARSHRAEAVGRPRRHPPSSRAREPRRQTDTIIYRMKAALIRLGIRGFRPELRRAPKMLDRQRSPGDLPIPPHTRRNPSR